MPSSAWLSSPGRVLIPATAATPVVAALALLLVASVAGLSPARAQGSAPPGALAAVPEPLRPWVPWVLIDSGTQTCPFQQGDTNLRRCVWPGPLSLSLAADGAVFEQTFVVDREGPATLPGEPRQWPQGVTVDGRAAPVISVADRPVLVLPPGTHRVAGRIRWASLPDVVRVPGETGVLSVTLDGRPVPFPQRDAEGRLWLQQAGGAAEAADHLEIQVHRRMDDDIPFLLETRLDLQVSGRSREVLLGPVLPAGFSAQGFEPSLPARLEPDGRLRVQVRAGSFSLSLTARTDGPVKAVVSPSPPAPWPTEEVWVLQAHPELRQVQVTGPPSVDPTQTRLPEGWRSLPAFLVAPGSTVTLDEQRRGDPAPPPDRLSLNRQIWLDFAGTGFTFRDEISGTLANAWRLEVQPPLWLGHVSVGGKDQLITRRDEGAPAGVELREGQLSLVADSRLDAGEGGLGRFSAVGWDQDFESARATLHLPPGWRLFDAGGMDEISGTWLRSWSLLDLFLLLLAVLATGSLFGWPSGVLALVALGLAFPERDSPQTVWLAVLAGEALRRVLPSGRAAGLLRLYRLGTGIVLVVWALPFLLFQVRVAMYPMLEHTWTRLGDGSPPVPMIQSNVDEPTSFEAPVMAGAKSMDRAAVVQAEVNMLEEGKIAAMQIESREREESDGQSSSLRSKTGLKFRRKLQEVDPNAAVQTGPGLPGWAWNAVELSWSGPVQRSQDMRLVLLSPGVNLLLGFLRAVLVGLLVLVVLGGGPGAWRRRLAAARAGTPTPPPPNAPPVAPVALVLGLALVGAVAARPALAQGLPSPELLDTLQARLLAPPSCAPACADATAMRLSASPGALTVRLEIGAAAATAVPLPGGAGQWTPERLRLDGAVAPVTRDDAGTLWLRVGPGFHVVELAGPLPPRETVDLALPLRPRFVEAELKGYTVLGLEPGGVAAETLQLVRSREETAPDGTGLGDGAPLPPFARVERTISIGLDWTVETRVVRTSPPGSSIVLSVPLLAGESVTTAGVKVDAATRRVEVNMGPQAGELVWQSILSPAETVTLTAASGVPFTERWRLLVSAIWHVEPVDGPPVVRRQDEQGARLPEWRPYPGEVVTLKATRPAAVSGQTLTIDDAKLRVNPGLRATDAVLTVSLRASRGGPHVVTLPAAGEGLLVQEVKLGDAVIPVSPDAARIELPLAPGAQTAVLRWQTATPLGLRYVSPAVDLGQPAVNATVEVDLPGDRWVLFAGGPRSGPAVLFWSMLMVVLAASFVLGRSSLTPLRWWHWVGLALGLSQTWLPLTLVLVGWFFALGLRGRHPMGPRWAFNLAQLALMGWTLVSAAVLVASIQHGLLGLPNMQVEGNGSHGGLLRWFVDRVDGVFPSAWVISVPLMVYRVLMLAWALWLARSLLRWVRWGWGCFSAGGYWRAPVRAETKTPPPAPSAPETPPAP
jgi:hypothetical protein